MARCHMATAMGAGVGLLRRRDAKQFGARLLKMILPQRTAQIMGKVRGLIHNISDMKLQNDIKDGIESLVGMCNQISSDHKLVISLDYLAHMINNLLRCVGSFRNYCLYLSTKAEQNNLNDQV